MATTPNRPLSGFRFVQIRQNDTLQQIAARALNDASRWPDLININGLTYPYLTGDPTLAGPTVLLYGQFLVVPAAAVQPTATVDPDKTFGTDFELDDDGNLIIDETGDIQTVTGVANLSQALRHRIATNLRELLFHLAYGCGVRRTMGQGNGPTTGLLGAQYVKTALIADPRVASVDSASVAVQADASLIAATIEPIAGPPINVQVSV